MLRSAELTPRRLDWVGYATITLLAVLVLVTVVLLAVPGTTGHIVAPELDIVLDTTATVVTATIAFLSWDRYAEYRDPLDHATSAAFLVLAVINGVAVLLAVTGFPDPDQGPLHIAQDQAMVFATGRFVATALLVFGGVASLRGHRPPLARVAVVTPAVVTIAVVVVVEAAVSPLPQIVEVSARAGAGPALDVSTTPFGAAVQLIGAGLTMAAALVWYRLWRASGSTSQGYLVLGLVIASFAQVHTVVYPSVHPFQVSTGDILWLVFGAILVLAIEAESRSTLGKLRSANTALEELREVDVERAALEERSRVSRELHDGLAQGLWLAKLKAGRLAALPNLDAEAVDLSNEVAGAIDDSLAEARHAVMALRLGTDSTHATLCSMMHRVVDDFADRVGVRTEFECDHSRPQVGSRVAAEILRVAQEALTNVRRHADATLVNVRFESRDGMVSVMVADNGRGFDPTDHPDGKYGIVGMRERAALVHGLLTVDSRPADGTRVTIEVPLDQSPTLQRAGA